MVTHKVNNVEHRDIKAKMGHKTTRQSKTRVAGSQAEQAKTKLVAR